MKKIYTLTLMAFVAFSLSAQLFTEDFEDGIAAIRWDVVEQGTSNIYNLAFDYVAAGIAAAPNGGGLGMKMEVNTSVGESSQVVAFPKDQTFTGAYTISFDCWMNWTGDAGTTEFAIWGAKNTDGLVPSYTGYELAVTGDGGSGSDVRFYVDGGSIDVDSAVDPDTTNVYVAGTRNFTEEPYTLLGTYAGMQWLEVDIMITADSAKIYVNNELWIRALDTIPDGNLSLGYADWFTSSIADNTVFIVYDNVVVTAASTGINNTQKAITSKMYPNPAQEYITVEVNESSTLELVNTVGQIVHKSIVEGKSTVSLSNLKSGMYIGKITSRNGEVEMHKILVK